MNDREEKYSYFYWIALYIKVRLKIFREFLCVVYRYYRKPRFALTHLLFLMSYLWSNPYTISRRYWQKKESSHVHTYGETPLTTLEKIAKACLITHKDSVLELGCGRGMNLVWLNDFIRCQTWGVDIIPIFTKVAHFILSIFKRPKILIEQRDFLELEMNQATVVLLSDPFISDDAISILKEKCRVLRKGSRVFSLSFPLCASEKKFRLKQKVELKYLWGTTSGYIYEKIKE